MVSGTVCCVLCVRVMFYIIIFWHADSWLNYLASPSVCGNLVTCTSSDFWHYYTFVVDSTPKHKSDNKFVIRVHLRTTQAQI